MDYYFYDYGKNQRDFIRLTGWSFSIHEKYKKNLDFLLQALYQNKEQFELEIHFLHESLDHFDFPSFRETYQHTARFKHILRLKRTRSGADYYININYKNYFSTIFFAPSSFRYMLKQVGIDLKEKVVFSELTFQLNFANRRVSINKVFLKKFFRWTTFRRFARNDNM